MLDILVLAAIALLLGIFAWVLLIDLDSRHGALKAYRAGFSDAYDMIQSYMVQQSEQGRSTIDWKELEMIRSAVLKGHRS